MLSERKNTVLVWENWKLLYSKERDEIVSLNSRNVITRWRLTKNDHGFYTQSNSVKSIDFSYNRLDFEPVLIKKYKEDKFFLIEHFTGCIWVIDWDSLVVNNGYQIPYEEGDNSEASDIIYLQKINLFIAGGGASSLYFINPLTDSISACALTGKYGYDYIDHLCIDEKTSLLIHSDIDQENVYELCRIDTEHLKISRIDRFDGGSRDHYDGLTFIPETNKFVCVYKWQNIHNVKLMELKSGKVQILKKIKIKLSNDSEYKNIRKCSIHLSNDKLVVCGGNKVAVFSLADLSLINEVLFETRINDSILINKKRQLCLGTNEGLMFWDVN